jgi:integrase
MALTDIAVKSAKPAADRLEIADGRGLFLVIQPSGAKSWAYRGRVNGSSKKIKLGDFPEIKLSAARDRAAAARTAAHAGRVYVAPRPEGAPEAARKGSSVREVWAQYRELRLEPECRPATVAEHARIFAAHIQPALGCRDIATVSKVDCLVLADAALKRGFSARNKLIAVLTAFFGTWCHEDRDMIAADPTRGIKQRTNKQTNGNGKRALDDAEVGAFWKACGAIDAANLSSVRFGAMFQLLLLTGARRNEVAGLSDAEIKGNVWTLPGERAKNGKALRVHLTKTAQAILKSVPRIEGCAYVFGPTGGKCGFGFSKAKDRLDAEAVKIKTAWRLHDLRRTFRSGLGKLGVHEEIAERCVNHPPGGLVGIYDQHKYEAEMAEAWQRWERHVLKVAR